MEYLHPPVVLSLIGARYGRPIEVYMKLEHHATRIVALETNGELRCGRTLGNALHGHNGARLVAPGHIALKGHTIDAHQAAREHQGEQHAMMELGDLLEIPIGTHIVDLLGKFDELERTIQLVIHIDLETALQYCYAKGEALTRH